MWRRLRNARSPRPELLTSVAAMGQASTYLRAPGDTNVQAKLKTTGLEARTVCRPFRKDKQKTTSNG